MATGLHTRNLPVIAVTRFHPVLLGMMCFLQLADHESAKEQNGRGRDEEESRA